MKELVEQKEAEGRIRAAVEKERDDFGKLYSSLQDQKKTTESQYQHQLKDMQRSLEDEKNALKLLKEAYDKKSARRTVTIE